MIKIVVIGLGVMGSNHYRLLKTNPNVKIVALCDIDNQNNYKENFYTDVDEMIEKEEIDAAIVAVPTFLHKEVALKLVDKKINMLIEKPVASDIEDAKEILKAAKEADITCVVGHVERFNPVVNTLKKELEGREIYSVAITRVGPFPPRISDVGVLTDLSVHDIDLVRYVTGREILKTSIFKSKKIHNHYEDNAILSFELEDNIVAGIITNWITPFKKRTVEVACENVYFEANMMTQDLVEYSQYHKNNSYVVRNCFVRKDEPLKKELEAFIEQIKTGGNNKLSSVEDSIITLNIANY